MQHPHPCRIDADATCSSFLNDSGTPWRGETEWGHLLLPHSVSGDAFSVSIRGSMQHTSMPTRVASEWRTFNSGTSNRSDESARWTWVDLSLARHSPGGFHTCPKGTSTPWEQSLGTGHGNSMPRRQSRGQRTRCFLTAMYLHAAVEPFRGARARAILWYGIVEYNI